MARNGVRGTVLTAVVAATGVVTVAAALVTPGATASASGSRPGRLERPPASAFTHGRVTNEWFPLRPGTRMVYRGVKDGKHAVDVFVVTRRTRTIQKVTCRVVHDELRLDGVLVERTLDWYAQSRDGDVWYFGERTAELGPRGRVLTRDGSWMAGRNGARAGIYITGQPSDGQSRPQELFPGHAEDHFQVVNTSARVRVPLVRSSYALLTREWTPLEPHVVDHKFYVRDIGVVSEQSVSGPRETGRLVSITHTR